MVDVRCSVSENCLKIRWLSSALDGLVRLHTYIAVENPRAAHRVTSRVRRTALQLRLYPHSGRLGNVPGTRELPISGLPVVLVYRVASDAVEILRVFHTSTNWQGVAGAEAGADDEAGSRRTKSQEDDTALGHSVQECLREHCGRSLSMGQSPFATRAVAAPHR
jgi:toxin ParE1/3/4